MKKVLVALLFAFVSTAAFAGMTRNMGTDPTTVSATPEVSCNLYRASSVVPSALVMNTPVVAAAGKVSCSFPNVVLNTAETYVATYQNAVGFEGDPSLPFATGSAPGKPGAPKIVGP